MDVDQT